MCITFNLHLHFLFDGSAFRALSRRIALANAGRVTLDDNVERTPLTIWESRCGDLCIREGVSGAGHVAGLESHGGNQGREMDLRTQNI